MNPEHEEIEPATLENDKSRISDLLGKVSDDGYQVQDEAQAPATEGLPSEEVEELEPVQQETETTPSDETPPQGEGEQAPVSQEQVEETSTEDLPQDDYEREIEDKYQPPKGASTRTTEVLKILKKINREEHREKKALQKEVENWQAKKLLDETTEKELQDLRNLRSRVAIETDPEFNQKYIQGVQKHEAQAMGVMRHFNLPEETAKFIQDQGGLLRFRDSERRMPMGTQDLEGKAFNGTQADWYRKVLEPMMADLPASAKTRFDYHVNEATKTAIQRDEAMAEARGNPQKFIQERQQKWDSAVKEYAERADKQAAKESDLYGEIARPREVPDKATPEVKAEVLAHNARLENSRESIKKGFSDETPEHRMQAEMALAYRDFAQNHVKAVEKDRDEWKIKATDLQAKWDKAKNVAQTTRQQSTVQQPKDRQPAKKYDAAESIRGLMESIPA